MSELDRRMTKMGRNMMRFPSRHASINPPEPTKDELREMLKQAVANTARHEVASES